MNEHRVFAGPDSIKHYLDPRSHPFLPLVELPPSLNPFARHGVHIFAKMMTFLPLGNVKSVPAYSMVAHSDLSDTTELVEASSGNTVLSLGMIARAFGIDRVRALVSKEVSRGKLDLLRICGIDVEIVDEPICPDPADPAGAIAQARTRSELPGVTNLGQYSNELNPRSHYELTAPEISVQLQNKVDIVALGAGTTGTLVGVGRYVREHHPSATVLAVTRKPNNAIPGVRTTTLLREVAFDWREACDEIIEIGRREAFEESLSLIRCGLLVGPSGGLALAGLLQHLRQAYESGLIDQGAEKNAVFVCPDLPFAYAREYYDVLPSSYFPAVVNSELLQDELQLDQQEEPDPHDTITVEELVSRFLTTGPSGTSVIRPDCLLIDVREPSEYADHHLEQSVNIPLGSLEDQLDALESSTTCIFLCRSGHRSVRAAQIAQRRGLVAFSVEGGTTEWSARGWPRTVGPACGRDGSVPSSPEREEAFDGSCH